MTDYYPLIARAVAGLPKNTGDGRRAFYERARTALVAQLRGVTPALAESEITRERLALEEAIRKVEAEAARQSWVEPKRAEPTPKMRPPEPAAWDEPAPPEHDEPPPRPEPAPRPSAAARMPRSAPMPARPAPPPPRRSQPDVAARAEPRHEYDTEHGPAGPDAAREQGRTRFAGRRSLMDSGLKDFREVVSEADELGAASARSARSARENYSEPPEETGREADLPQQWPPPREADLRFADASDQRMLEPEFNLDDSRPMPPQDRGEETGRAERKRPLRSLARFAKLAAILVICAALGSLPRLAMGEPDRALPLRTRAVAAGRAGRGADAEDRKFPIVSIRAVHSSLPPGRAARPPRWHSASCCTRRTRRTRRASGWSVRRSGASRRWPERRDSRRRWRSAPTSRFRNGA